MSHNLSISGSSCSEVVSGSITTGLKGKNAGFLHSSSNKILHFVYSTGVLVTWWNLITYHSFTKQLSVMDNPYSSMEGKRGMNNLWSPCCMAWVSLPRPGARTNVLQSCFPLLFKEEDSPRLASPKPSSCEPAAAPAANTARPRRVGHRGCSPGHRGST